MASTARTEDTDFDKPFTNGYRELLAAKLGNNHEQLEKLIWQMQDALDEIVAESQKQVDCLGEIEDLFEHVKRGKRYHRTEG